MPTLRHACLVRLTSNVPASATGSRWCRQFPPLRAAASPIRERVRSRSIRRSSWFVVSAPSHSGTDSEWVEGATGAHDLPRVEACCLIANGPGGCADDDDTSHVLNRQLTDQVVEELFGRGEPVDVPLFGSAPPDGPRPCLVDGHHQLQ